LFFINDDFKNGFWVQRVITDGRRRVLINPTALLGACEIDKIAKFLLTLTYKKRPPRIEPWWPSFCGLKSFLNVSINKRPFSFSEVVFYKNVAPLDITLASGACNHSSFRESRT
jgi:hypothetical protein